MKNTPFSMLSYQSGLIASLALCSSMAQGAVTVSFSDSQAGLVVEWSGTLDVSSLTPSGDFLQDPPFGTLNGFGLSVVNTLDDLYAIQFGVEIVGGNIASNPIPLTSQILGSIDSFGFFVDFRDPELNGVIYVPDGFTSGSLNGEFLFPSLSVNELELEVGNYPWGSVSSNSVTFDLVPEPSSTLLAGLSGILFAFRRRR